MSDHDLSELQRRLDFLALDAATRALLADVYKLVEPKLPDVLAGFYRHVGGFHEIAGKIGNQQSRLISVQKTHWAKVFQARFDADYMVSARRIGMAHVKIGLEPRWYMGGYAFVMTELANHIGRAHRFSGPKAAAALAAVQKAIMLDMDMAISVYQEALMNQIRARGETVTSAVREFDGAMRESLNSLSNAAGTLKVTADTLRAVSADTEMRTRAVAGSAEETRSSVQTGAAATEELTASISEIGQQASKSLDIARRAVADAERTNQSVQSLAQMADRIGSVIGLITDIAGQTNLLALNATIEAARAGEAGRGFAVVASEVKSLAGQTAKATDEIGQQIAAIQQATQGAVNDIRAIGATIDEIASIATAIAAAVEEQGAATREIAMNIQGAAANTGQVSDAIAGIGASTTKSNAAAEDVTRWSVALDAQARQLDETARAFFARVQAA